MKFSDKTEQLYKRVSEPSVQTESKTVVDGLELFAKRGTW